MAYDLHGTWDKITNHHAALYANPAEPADTANGNIDRAVTDYLAAGVPPAKLVLGVPFRPRLEGRAQHQQRAVSTGNRAREVERRARHRGVSQLKNLGYPAFRDPVAQAFWVYSPSTGIFWSYDDPTSLLKTAVANLLNRPWEEAIVKVRQISYIFSRVTQEFRRIRIDVDTAWSSLIDHTETRISSLKERITFFEKSVNLNDPIRQLKIGYSVVRHGGKILKSVQGVKTGDITNTQLSDGSIQSKVETVQ